MAKEIKYGTEARAALGAGAFFIIIGGDDSVNKPFTTQLLGSTMS